MKKTKIFLAALLMLVLTATAVFADGSVFTLSDVSGRPGDVVKVDIFLSADEMIDTIGLRDIEFDEDVLTFKGFSDYDEIEDKAIISQFDNGKGAAVIGFEDAEAFDGKICSVKFYIADDADEGTYDVDMLSSLKLGSEQLDSSVEAGSVTVCHQITGDLSLDNNVDLKDAILLLQYSMFPELYPLDYLGSADFNGDDEVDMNDAILLLQYSMFPDLYPLNPDGGEDEEEYEEARISIDGDLLKSEPSAIYVDGDVLAPARDFFEALGAIVEWDSEIETVFAERDGTEIEITLGNDIMYVKGEPVSLDTPAMEIDGFVMVPAVAVAKAFGCTVGYNSDTGTNIITTPKDKDYVVAPKNGKENVDLYEKIVFTFSERVYNEFGEDLTATYITDTFELRATLSSGTMLGFEAEVSADGKKITIIPDWPFNYKTKYYVIIPDDTLTYADGSGNNKIISSFTTREFDGFENLIIPTTVAGERVPREVVDDETDEVTWYIYARVDGRLKYVPVKVDKRNPEIIDEDGNLTPEYEDKICTYFVDEEGLYTIISAGYDEESPISDDITVLDSKTDAEAMYYAEGMSGTIEKIAGSRYQIADFERIVYLTASTQIIIKSYDEENEEYVYTEYTPSVFAANYDEATELKNISFVLYNYIESAVRENLAVLYAETASTPSEEEEKNIRVVSDFVGLDDEDGLWRFYYDLYDPFSGTKVESVASVEGEKKASMLDEDDAYERGTIIELEDGMVSHKSKFNKGLVDNADLVYITEVDEAEGYFSVVNYNDVTGATYTASGVLDTGIECKDCIKDNVEDFNGGVNDFVTGDVIKDGNGNATTFIEYDKNTAVTVITRTGKFETINHWADGTMALSDMAAIADADKSLLCWNDWAKDRNGSYKKGYADYVKAYVSVVDEKLEEGEYPVADFVIVIVNRDEPAALDSYDCELCRDHGHDETDHCEKCGMLYCAAEEWCSHCESHDHDLADCPEYGHDGIGDDATGDEEL